MFNSYSCWHCRQQAEWLEREQQEGGVGQKAAGSEEHLEDSRISSGELGGTEELKHRYIYHFVAYTGSQSTDSFSMSPSPGLSPWLAGWTVAFSTN